MTQAEPTIPDPLRVLFIGNSIGFFNDLPDMFVKLPRSYGHKAETEMAVQRGNHCLECAAARLFGDAIDSALME